MMMMMMMMMMMTTTNEHTNTLQRMQQQQQHKIMQQQQQQQQQFPASSALEVTTTNDMHVANHYIDRPCCDVTELISQTRVVLVSFGYGTQALSFMSTCLFRCSLVTCLM